MRLNVSARSCLSIFVPWLAVLRLSHEVSEDTNSGTENGFSLPLPVNLFESSQFQFGGLPLFWTSVCPFRSNMIRHRWLHNRDGFLLPSLSLSCVLSCLHYSSAPLQLDILQPFIPRTSLSLCDHRDTPTTLNSFPFFLNYELNGGDRFQWDLGLCSPRWILSYVAEAQSYQFPKERRGKWEQNFRIRKSNRQWRGNKSKKFKANLLAHATKSIKLISRSGT